MKRLLSFKVPLLLLLSCLLMCAPRVVQARSVAQARPVAETRATGDRYNAAGISDSAAADKFFASLQRAVALNQKSKVALMVSYPLRVRVSGRRLTLKHTSALLRHYDAVFNRKVKAALAAQRSANLFSNWQGVMIGNGEIWFNQMSGKPGKAAVFKITAINN